MLNQHELLSLKAKHPEPDKLVDAVNVGSHNEAIKQASALCDSHALTGIAGARLCSEDLLALLLSQVDEEIVIEDSHYDWTTVSEWASKHPNLSPLEAGWLLEGNQLYRPKVRRAQK